MNDEALESVLRRLPEPAPPAGLSAAVLLRAARRDEAREAAARAASDVRARRAHARLAWVATLAGIAVSLGGQVFGLLTGEMPFDPAPSRIRVALVNIPSVGTAMLLLTLGLSLYLTGLFAVIGKADRSRRRV
jgi:hypothetical protein